MGKNFKELQDVIGYHFNDINNLDIALTHKSYANEMMVKKRESYERYEFLGDAILEFLVSEFLFTAYPEKPEGELTKLRASLVCEFTLSKISRELNLGEYGYFSKGEKNTGGANRDSILCDFFESLLGAIYIDGGLDEAKKFVGKFLLTDIEHKKRFHDSKSTLQEYAQKHDKKLEYVLDSEEGPDHNKIYKVHAVFDGKNMACGSGNSRKGAEQMAAYNTLNDILKLQEW